MHQQQQALKPPLPRTSEPKMMGSTLAEQGAREGGPARCSLVIVNGCQQPGVQSGRADRFWPALLIVKVVVIQNHRTFACAMCVWWEGGVHVAVQVLVSHEFSSKGWVGFVTCEGHGTCWLFNGFYLFLLVVWLFFYCFLLFVCCISLLHCHATGTAWYE